MSIIIFLTILVVSASARRPRILGGVDAEIEDFPYQVSLQAYGKHLCGASIVSKNYVLTAAHCLTYYNINELSIRSGSAYHAKNGQIHKVVKKITNHDGDFDIAVLKIQPPFSFDKTRQPIQLVEKKPEADSLAYVTGWGHLQERGENSDKLQVVQVPVVSNADCSKAYHMKIDKSELCAGLLGVRGKDSCQNDSGGPLAVGNRLAGVVSRGDGCGRPEFPGVYADVAHLANWIKNETDI